MAKGSLSAFIRKSAVGLLPVLSVLAACEVNWTGEVEGINVIASVDELPIESARYDRDLANTISTCLDKLKISVAKIDRGYVEYPMPWYQPTPGGTAISRTEYIDVPAVAIYSHGEEEASYLLLAPPLALWKMDGRRYIEFAEPKNSYSRPVTAMIINIVRGDPPC